jgi:hypothetical protein
MRNRREAMKQQPSVGSPLRSEVGPRNRGVGPFFARLPPGARRIAMALRDTVLENAPGVAETLLWGALSYHRPAVGGRVKGAVCSIDCKRGEVRLAFIHGIRLSDPTRMLGGKGISKRGVLVDTIEAARAPALATLVREAAALEWDSEGRSNGSRTARRRSTARR